MEFTPEALRSARFTERFRGYDAAEVDAYLTEAAEALEELVAENSQQMTTLAVERARQSIEQVRLETLEEIEELNRRRDDLAQAVAELQQAIQERRRGLAEVLDLIDAMTQRIEQPEELKAHNSPLGDEAAVGADDGPSAEADSFLARLERAASDGGDSGAT